MATVTKDMGDMKVLITRGELLGVPCVHEVQLGHRGVKRSRWYVDGAWAATLPPAQRRMALKLPEQGGFRFEKGLRKLLKEARP